MIEKDYGYILRSDAAGIAELTLNRPARFNALSEKLLEQLQAALDEIKKDQTVRVVILKARGRAFCVGHDLKEMRKHVNESYLKALFSRCGKVMQSIQQLPQPVIACVHAVATAGGCQLVAACDMAVASDQAEFAVSGIKLGLFCSTPAVALSRNISRKRAMKMLMTGEFINAETALDFGLINDVVAQYELEAAVLTLATTIAAKPPAAIAMGKASFYQQLNLELDHAYALSGDTISCNMLLDETLEGVDAFLEKRQPSWNKPE